MNHSLEEGYARWRDLKDGEVVEVLMKSKDGGKAEETAIAVLPFW